MPFDDATRGRLQRFVGAARALLTEEFARQLQQDYGLDPSTGDVAAIDSLADRDDRRRETARILCEILQHYLAADFATGREGQRNVLDRIVREQAFTILNRLAALRMMEARGILIESVAKGYQSRGFQLYQRVANGALGETGEAYRCFLFSVFDTFAAELPALFDRHAPQGRLFPRETALLAVLKEFDAPDLEPLWGEDETIGWIYQYFNSREERQAMRRASQAPRNSRELAVRNQFFTPRYVVEFLVDNTLGRLWFNWSGGTTSLRDRCQYLLVKPDEQPEAAERLRDPRTIKLLDPACGSMHFGLYAFDLFLEIYREAWAWEAERGAGSLDTSTQPEARLKPLSQTYPDEAAFLQDGPRLIIEHNIYGAEIDPRAAQIASLALWLRAQRAWHEADVKATDRPSIGRGNVVAAVAPPAEVDIRKELMAEMDELDAELFEKTLFLLKGLPELGVLLQVERELPALIRQVYGVHGPMFRRDDDARWQKAEKRLRAALTQFARAATYQSRLFAQDALEGLRLIDLTGQQFDAVVMNPPFGEPTSSTIDYVKSAYPSAFIDILSTFIERARTLCPAGYIGALTSRACLYTKTLQTWREHSFLQSVEAVADLGGGVLDGAMVFACASILKQPRTESPSSVTFDLRRHADRKLGLSDASRKIRHDEHNSLTYSTARESFFQINCSRYIYNIPDEIWHLARSKDTLSKSGGSARAGSTTYDDFRFIRLVWEVRPERVGWEHTWVNLSKGGYFETYYNDIHLVINWKHNGREVGEFNRIAYGTDAQSKRASSYYKLPAVTYPRRNVKGFSPRVLPRDCIFADKGPAIFSPKMSDPAIMLGYLNSEPIRALITLQVQAGSFETGIINSLPWLKSDQPASEIGRLAKSVWGLKLALYRYSEVDRLFVPPTISRGASLSDLWIQINQDRLTRSREIREICKKISEIVIHHFALPEFEFESLEVGLADHDIQEDLGGSDKSSAINYFLQLFAGVAFGRWDYRLVSGERAAPSAPDPFDPLPANSPGTLPDGAVPFHLHFGILVDDPGHPHDLPRLIEDVLATVDLATAEDVRQWLRRDFFTHHLKQYSKSRRKAPIYWPLSTSSGGYTLWLYYPALTDQTLYTAANDFVGPKLEETIRLMSTLRTRSDRSRDEERLLEQLQDLGAEMKALQDELLRLAPMWKPNHDDGVQITAAPLWRLFRHRSWQTVLKETWEKLEGGDYDWAHLAMTYWPERVREKCRTDKSLAIAHDMEDLYEPPPEKPSAGRRDRKRAVEAV